MPAGRPSDYTQELAYIICEEIMQGKSLRAICKREDMPALSTICRWLSNNKDFQEQYTRAREIQAELLADEIIEISDDGSKDEVEHPMVEGATMTNYENIQRSKLKVDSRKWVASKLLPKKYGDKQEIQHTGQIVVVDVPDGE